MRIARSAAASKEFIPSNPIKSHNQKDSAAPELGYLYPLYMGFSKDGSKTEK